MKKSVLIVDDEETARESLARLLRTHGHEVRTAGNSQDATHELGVQAADAVLLDLDLPHVPGESLAAFLKLRHPKTQIIFMSGQYDMVNPERFGVHAIYFRKPIDVDDLLEALASQDSAEGLGTPV
jgi:DNA-binding NtrC family response regulator